MPFRKLERALDETFSGSECPESIIEEFWNAHHPIENADSARLHEDLKRVSHNRAELSTGFLAALVRLAPLLTAPQSLEFWFSKLAMLALDSAGRKNTNAKLAKQFLCRVAMAEPDGAMDDANAHLLAKLYLGKIVRILVDFKDPFWTQSASDSEERIRFIKYTCRNLLVEIGARNMADVLTCLNAVIADPQSRCEVLQVLSQLAEDPNSNKMSLLGRSPLLPNLLHILEYDNDGPALAMAATTLGISLPHLGTDLIPLLPQLFGCYGRLCSWQPPAFMQHVEQLMQSSLEPSPLLEPAQTTNREWKTLDQNVNLEFTPSVDPLFMVLYGLFPNNLMAFARSPAEYLRNKQHKLCFDDFWDRQAISSRTEDAFSRFLLNPLMLTSSVELEIEPKSQQWLQFSSSADIAAHCLSLRSVLPPVVNAVGVLQELTKANEQDTEEQLSDLLAEHQKLFVNASNSMAPSRLANSQGQALGSPMVSSRQQSQIGSKSPSRKRSPPPPSPSPLSPAAAVPEDEEGQAEPEAQQPVLYYQRELLLNRNELAFSNFARHATERRLRAARQQLREYDIAITKLDFYKGRASALQSQVRDLEADMQRQQQQTKTTLRQRATYETNLLDRIKELKAQAITASDLQQQLRTDSQRLTDQLNRERQASITRESELSNLEIELQEARIALKQALEPNQLKSELHEEDEEEEEEKEDLHKLEDEVKALMMKGEMSDVVAELDKAKAEIQALRQHISTLYRENKPSIKPNLYGPTLETAEKEHTKRFSQLSEENEKLRTELDSCMEELRVRKLHDERRTNELRTALLSTRALENDELRNDLRVRGRGGAQKAGTRTPWRTTA